MKTLLIILILASSCFAQDPAKQLSEITNDVEKRLGLLKASGDLKQQCTNDIAEARANLKLENLYLALYTIRTCQLELASRAYAETKAEVAKKRREALHVGWRPVGTLPR